MTLLQHPLSAAWPAMQSDEYQSLKDSVEIIGIQNPITLFEGQVIDGWHRYKAATELGLHCPSKLLGDVDPVDFVKSQNDARRHITASQKAAAIVAIYTWKPVGSNQHEAGRVPGTLPQKTNAELAAIAGVGNKTIKDAKAVHANATPEVKEAVKAGTMSVKAAAETIKPKKDKPAKPPKPKAQPEPQPAPAPVDDEGAPDQAELDMSAAHLAAEAKTIALLLASDAQLSELAEKNTQLELQITQLNWRIQGLMNEKNEHIAMIKRLQKQIKKQDAS